MRIQLNKINRGINGIDYISLEKIEQIFGKPETRILEIDGEGYGLEITYKYNFSDLTVSNAIFFYDDLTNRKVYYQSLFFTTNCLWLFDDVMIQVGDEIKKIFWKIEEFCKQNDRKYSIECEEDEHFGTYDFLGIGLQINFEKEKKKKLVYSISILLPHENNLAMPSIEFMLFGEKNI